MADFLTEIGGQLDQALGELDHLFQKRDEHGDFDWSPEDVDKHRELETKSIDLRKKRDDHLARERSRVDAEATKADLKRVNRPGLFSGGDGAEGSAGYHGQPRMSAIDLLVKSVIEHPDLKDYRPNRPVSLKLKDFDFGRLVQESRMGIDLKTVMTTAAGFAPPSLRGNVQVSYAIRRPMVGDLIPQDTIGPMNGVRYMEETTWTNSAAPVAEGAAKPESANAWTERAVTIEVIATTLPVTEQQLEDVPQIESIVRNRLVTMVLLAEEDQLLNGTGTSPSLQGFLTKTGVQVQAAGTDPTPDALLKAMTQVMSIGYASPTGIVMNPTNYMNMRLLRTADGIYIFGNPSGPADVSIWGVPPVVTNAMTSGTSLVGDFQNFSHISRRKEVTIDIGFVNDDFKRNQRTIRAEERVSLEIYRPAAFSKVTGLN